MVKQGREPQLRAVQAQSEVANASAALDEAQAFRDAALARLAGAALLDAPVQSIGDSLLDRAPPLPRGATDTALAVRIAEAEADAAGKLVDVERKRALPDLSVTAAQTRFREGRARLQPRGQPQHPAVRPQPRGIRAANADQRAAEARLDQQRRDSEAARLSAVAGLKAARSRTRAADESVVAAEEAYRLARIGFDAGRISQLELRSTRSALIAARGIAVDARLSRVGAESILPALKGAHLLWRSHDALPYFPADRRRAAAALLAGCAGNAQTPANEDPAAAKAGTDDGHGHAADSKEAKAESKRRPPMAMRVSCS